MFSEREIYIAVVSTVTIISIAITIIKRLSDRMLAYLDQTLLELKNNDAKLFEKIGTIESCSAGMKKDIEHNEADIYKLGEDLSKCKDKHIDK